MRSFYSYGPVDCRSNFCVHRRDLIERCAGQLVGDIIDEGGRYFTIWAPRQTGKTWVMRQVRDDILARYKDHFIVGTMSVQGTVFKDDDDVDHLLDNVPMLIWETFKLNIDTPDNWQSFRRIFDRTGGIFDRPVILFIDEFDSLPPKVIDMLVKMFRDMYLKRDSYLLHGLALIGVRTVLGVESERGSPFNVQRSMHIPNFSKEEVAELFRQYVDESGQDVAPIVVDKLYRVTRGQPGLVCWFGELLTEKYNPGVGTTIDDALWGDVYGSALSVEFNNTTLNLIKKVKGAYQQYAVSLFTRADIPFNMDKDWCNYLYMNGVIDTEVVVDDKGQKVHVCRFSSSFVQERIYNVLTDILADIPILPIGILDALTDVFEPDRLNLPALLERYKDYLRRLSAKGINPWQGQPRRADLHYTEAVGHFHLYAWLQAAVGRRCIISPEFPTGNGKVDLHLRCGGVEGIIEVKSLTNVSALVTDREQAAGYAAGLGRDAVTIALFVPSEDEDVHAQLSGVHVVGQVTVTVVSIGCAI
ncbi:MAG: AAA-like domain-containing protein [Nitrospirae bacterium]|uniref:AAA-like domain-containing protein n=1 Tax=Candidatus Magnetobacterium casense TaxID=1455061 RepID=UPI00058C2755|nr:AAA-like domain-containing protein [Candidatus Magnetobacterium casensis]MBF0336756.1 AAA-like domain-containing protein [Nitrospirota bacterium]